MFLLSVSSAKAMNFFLINVSVSRFPSKRSDPIPLLKLADFMASSMSSSVKRFLTSSLAVGG